MQIFEVFSLRASWTIKLLMAGIGKWYKRMLCFEMAGEFLFYIFISWKFQLWRERKLLLLAQYYCHNEYTCQRNSLNDAQKTNWDSKSEISDRRLKFKSANQLQNPVLVRHFLLHRLQQKIFLHTNFLRCFGRYMFKKDNQTNPNFYWIFYQLSTTANIVKGLFLLNTIKFPPYRFIYKT